MSRQVEHLQPDPRYVSTALALVVWLCCLCAARQLQGQSAQPPTAAAAATQAAPAVDQSLAAPATLHGTVLYADGAPLSGARISLSAASGAPREAVSGADGSFQLTQLPVGSFQLTVTARGVQTVGTSGTLLADRPTELPPLTLSVATVLTQIDAISEQQAAEIEVKNEESQRVLGVLPNFFVTYNPSAVRLSTKQKFQLSGRTLIDPATFAVTAFTAGLEQASGAFGGFGGGAAGYARRYGANYGDAVTGTLLTGAIFPSLLHQDPRYFYKGTGGFKGRLWYVVSRSVVQKGDNGRWQPGYSNLLGDLGSAAISNAYYPSSDKRWASFTAREFGFGIAGGVIGNFLQEFVLNHFTTKRQP